MLSNYYRSNENQAHTIAYSVNSPEKDVEL